MNYVLHHVLHESVESIGPSAISRLNGSPVDFSYGLLRAVERSLWGDLSVRYIVIEDGGEIVAMTPVYIGEDINFNALLPRFVQTGYARMRVQFGRAAGYRAAIVGCLISDRGWIPMAAHADAAAVVQTLLRAIDDVVRASGAHFCLIKDIHCEFPDAQKAQIRSAGYVQAFSLPTIRVNVRYDSFDGYLESLSKNGRKHHRKTFRKAKERGLTLRRVRNFSAELPRVYPLFRATFLKARYQFEELSPDFFEACADLSEPETELVLCERGEDIVGALLVFRDKGIQLNKRIGLDYSYEDTGIVYMLLNYYGLRNAIENHASTVYLGQSTYIPKTRLGGIPEDQFVFIKPYCSSLRMSLPLQRLWLQRYHSANILRGVERGISI